MPSSNIDKAAIDHDMAGQSSYIRGAGANSPTTPSKSPVQGHSGVPNIPGKGIVQ